MRSRLLLCLVTSILLTNPACHLFAKPQDVAGSIANATLPQGKKGFNDLTVEFYQNEDANGTPPDPAADSGSYCYAADIGNKEVYTYASGLKKGCVHNISYIRYIYDNPVTGAHDNVLVAYREGELPDSIPVLLPNQYVYTSADYSAICIQANPIISRDPHCEG